MRKILVFNHISLDGYFTDAKGEMSFAHGKDDPEWAEFTESNTRGETALLFGRITYDLMAGFWPTPLAEKQMPVVAEKMNKSQKIVFSRTLDKATWNNTRLMKGDLVSEVKKLKNEPGADLVIFGSGTIISQLAPHGLIDGYQLVVNPVVLGAGRTMFEGVKERFPLKLTQSRAFRNGNVVLSYEPMP